MATEKKRPRKASNEILMLTTYDELIKIYYI